MEEFSKKKKKLGRYKGSWHLLHMELSTCGRSRRLSLDRAVWLNVCCAICFSCCCLTRVKGWGITWPHSGLGSACNSLGLLQPHEQFSSCCPTEKADKTQVCGQTWSKGHTVLCMNSTCKSVMVSLKHILPPIFRSIYYTIIINTYISKYNYFSIPV